jgi:hypothetical protein
MTSVRTTRPWLWLVAGLFVATAAVLSQPQQAAAIDLPGPCDVPGVSVVCDAAGDAASAAAQAAGGAVLGQLTSWVGDGAAWLLRQVADAIDATTAVDLSAPWFQTHYAFMFQVGALLLLPLVLLTVLQALLRQDGGVLIRLVLLHLPAAMLLTGLAVTVTQTALAVVDSLCSDLTAQVARDTDSLAAALTEASVVGGPVPLFASFLMALVMAFAAIFVWFELILRAGVVYVAMMFLPLFLATMIWPATSGWIRRLVQLIVAAVLSKLVIVATLSLGLSALSSGDGVSAVLAGAGMFLLAAFSPFVLFSLIPFAAEAAQPQREGRHALAAATGASLAWSVARTRMTFGTAGARPSSAAFGAQMGGPGARGPGGPAGPAGASVRPRPHTPGGGGNAAPVPVASSAASPGDGASRLTAPAATSRPSPTASPQPSPQLRLDGDGA